jgi:hypothetical protein
MRHAGARVSESHLSVLSAEFARVGPDISHRLEVDLR